MEPELESKSKKCSFTIRLAGQLFAIESLYPYVRDYCRDYLVSEECTEEPVVTPVPIRISPAEIAYERERSAAEDHREGIPVRSFTDEYLETLAVYRKIAEALITCDTLLFHGSVVAVDGEGYLFTAKSGTGKSTHTALWREVFGDRAVMVNDDKPLLRITGEGVTAYGTPWDGKHHLSTNIAVPLRGIAILTRDVTNHIEPLSRRAAYPRILQQTYRPGDPQRLSATLQLVDRLLRRVPVYRLGCNMEPEAARVAYEGMAYGNGIQRDAQERRN